jgi:hypothetical protein
MTVCGLMVRRLHGLSTFAQGARTRMIWLVAGLVICAAIVVAGRAHSRYLDRLDDLHAKGYLNKY